MQLLPLLFAAMTSTSSAAGTVRLDLDDCIPSRDLVSDLVSIEIGFDRVVDGDADVVVRSACDRDFLRIFVARDRPMAGAQDLVVLDIAERRIALSDVRREGGARLVALNVAELVNDAPVVAVAPAAPAAVPAVTAPIRTQPESSAVTLRIGAAPIVRLLPSPGRMAVGMRGSVSVDGRTTPWTASLDGGFEQSASTFELGDVRTRVLSIAALGGLRHAPSEVLSLYLLGGVRGGWAWLESTPNDATVAATDGNGIWLGPMIGARVRYGRSVGISLGIEGGWTTNGIVGDAGGAPAGLVDGWLGADLTIDWSSS